MSYISLQTFKVSILKPVREAVKIERKKSVTIVCFRLILRISHSAKKKQSFNLSKRMKVNFFFIFFKFILQTW